MTDVLDFRAIDEPAPGAKWQNLFVEFWPAYEQWFLREGDQARPTYAACRRALREQMPELVETWERLVDLAGGGDRAARFLSLYCPTPFLTGCSQAIWSRGTDGIALVRNYDYAPHLCDGVILRSAWTDTGTIASVDCLWGVLDGMNEHGLAVALAFGGRQVVGEGFAITLILRSVLETCATVADATRVLRRVTPHMAYNVSAVDAGGAFVTAFLGPDRRPVICTQRVSANHQRRVEWAAHAQASRSVEREALLRRCIEDPDETLASLTKRFFAPPLYRTDYDRGRGTLYTAVYRPDHHRAEYHWPGRRWQVGFDDFPEQVYVARYDDAAAGAAPAPPDAMG